MIIPKLYETKEQILDELELAHLDLKDGEIDDIDRCLSRLENILSEYSLL